MPSIGNYVYDTEHVGYQPVPMKDNESGVVCLVSSSGSGNDIDDDGDSDYSPPDLF